MLNRGQVINWGTLLFDASVLPIAVIFSSRPSVPLAKVIARSGNTWRKSHHIWHAPPQWERFGQRSPWALKTGSKPTAKNAFAHYDENLNKLEWKIWGCLISEGFKKKSFSHLCCPVSFEWSSCSFALFFLLLDLFPSCRRYVPFQLLSFFHSGGVELCACLPEHFRMLITCKTKRNWRFPSHPKSVPALSFSTCTILFTDSRDMCCCVVKDSRRPL